MKAVDKWVKDFCYINNKFMRRRMIQQLYDISKAKPDQIPYAARLVAALHHKGLFVDVAPLLLEQIQKDRASLMSFRATGHTLKERKYNARYMSELTKFRICEVDDILA